MLRDFRQFLYDSVEKVLFKADVCFFLFLAHLSRQAHKVSL